MVKKNLGPVSRQPIDEENLSTADNQVKIMCISDKKSEKEFFFTRKEFEDFYELPTKTVKRSTGKKALKSGFKDFKENLYDPKALYNCFKTDNMQLPEWILAINKVLYQGPWSNQYDVCWDDPVIEKDGSQRFTDIEIRVADLLTKLLHYTLKIAFDTALISAQGTHYLEFIQEVFPDIKSLVKSSHVGKSPQKPQGRQPGNDLL